MGAQVALAEAGIKLYGGVQGNADDAVNALLNGNLAYDPDAKCDQRTITQRFRNRCKSDAAIISVGICTTKTSKGTKMAQPQSFSPLL